MRIELWKSMGNLLFETDSDSQVQINYFFLFYGYIIVSYFIYTYGMTPGYPINVNIIMLSRWLDKLGLAARLGHEVVIRQSFIKGSYALLDEELNPNPVITCTYFG